MTADELKRLAAARALEEVRDGMIVGLGTGSTARHFVELLGERVRAGLSVTGIPTSEATRADAERCGVPLGDVDAVVRLDLTVDGADEIDPELRLIKGGGGALLREKVIASASNRMIVIADESKWVKTLGAFALPIEVVPFGIAATGAAVTQALRVCGAAGPFALRQTRDGHAFVTDGGHWILDARLGRIDHPERLAASLNAIPGVVEHGLFLDLATAVILAGADGIRFVERRGRRAEGALA
ncbi:Ribose-5-phosphate isomerase A [Platysternon megacephalum]|uniref:ribose-5-phosphate isomerase n=1 Tax=Platysternon megacephalum TaxID=55544 RepID=A0A4D9DJB5_9SAUR|nr:Ribose-5-phosphate isomerase A [Platysternon megacephalum]